MQADWRPHLVTDGKLDRAIWEISLAFAVRDALRAGSLFLAESRDHVSFWNLVYDDRNWQQTREQAYQRLDLPVDGQAFLARITAEFDRAARAAERGLPSNRFAAVRDGRLKLKRRDALPIPRALRRAARHHRRQPAPRAHRGSAAGRRRMVRLHRRLPAARRLSSRATPIRTGRCSPP